MIRSFKCKETKKIFRRVFISNFSTDINKNARRKLLVLDKATILKDLQEIPGNRFKKLKGNRKGQYSIRINDQWRICFNWVDNNAYEVEIIDYH